MEVATEILKSRMSNIRETRDVNESRRYLDSVSITLPETENVSITDVIQEKVRGTWFSPKDADPDITILYCHGGGYSFYPKTYITFIALISLAIRARMFALDYRLAPEHRFPEQLEEALDAYRWLLQSGTNPKDVVIAGDSAGGNLTIALLLAAHDLKLPQPALAVALSPPTDFAIELASMFSNEDSDWIDKRMLVQWADWFCDLEQRRNPLVSPQRADLRDLAPIYIQAGRAEILYDSIQAFADRAQKEGADVVLESWEDMNHVFQLLGRYVPQSAEALKRLGEVVDAQVRESKKTKIVLL